MVDEPNQGATGEVPPEAVGTEPTSDARAGGDAHGETPLSVAAETDPFADRPELFVGAAFAAGFALAMILRRVAR